MITLPRNIPKIRNSLVNEMSFYISYMMMPAIVADR
jgi:hypothetical protein